MRRLNLAERCPLRLAPGASGVAREVRFGGARMFFDPGTLEAYEAEAPWERAPMAAGLEPEFPQPPASGPRALVLSVTHACNLACRYCYVRAKGAAGGGARGVMSRRTARRALTLLRPPGPWRVGFFGGEPLIAWDLVREVIALARERAENAGVRVSFSLTTNGTLLAPQRAEHLARAGCSLILSLDGPRDLHDRERRLGSKGGSYDLARAGLGNAAAAGLGPRLTLRGTFPLAAPALRARLEFLNELASQGYAQAVSVEPAWPSRGGADRLDRLEGEYLDAARWAAEKLGRGERVRFHHLQKALERILLLRPAGSECGAGFGYLDVAPDGSLHACHKEAGQRIGHVETGLVERLRAPWRENRWYGRESCYRCWARNVCGGGCRALSVEHTDSIARPYPVACAVKRLQARMALYVAAAASRGSLETILPAAPGRAHGVRRAVRDPA